MHQVNNKMPKYIRQWWWPAAIIGSSGLMVQQSNYMSKTQTDNKVGIMSLEATKEISPLMEAVTTQISFDNIFKITRERGATA